MVTIKKVISYILSILLVILLFAIILLVNLNFTLLNKSNVKAHISKTNYSEGIYNIIIDSCNNYIMQSGFDESILNDVIKKEDVEKNVDSIIDSMFDKSDINIETNEIRENLNSSIEKFIQDNNYALNEDNKKSIEEFEKTIEETYRKNILYSQDIVKEIGKYLAMATRIIKIAIIALAIVSLILLLIILKLNNPAIGIVMLATGILLIFIKCYSGINIAVNNILILNKPFSDFIVSLINQIMQNMFIVGIVLTVIGLIAIIWLEFGKKIKRMLFIEEHSQIIKNNKTMQ